MSLWSISAAKKKDEIPGSSKWIRSELFTLHDLIANDVEQFAYSVASEFTWIDEQMEEIINAQEKNPKLLLESPTKLRGRDSPVKKLRDHALALKSPLKEVDRNVLRLSPVKINKVEDLMDNSPSKKKSTNENKTVHSVKSPIKPIPLLPIRNDLLKPSEPTSQSPFLDAPKELSSHKSSRRPSATMESMNERTPIEFPPNLQEEKQQVSKIEANVTKEGSIEENPQISQFKAMDLKSQLSDNEGEDDGEYDASMEDLSFQAIRKSIRRSILRKSKASEEISTHTENSYKDAQDEGPLQSSLVVNQGSVDSTHESKSSNSTIKVSLRDDTSAAKVGSNTPPHNRQSQGFALLPHRDPLTVKSAKKKLNDDSEKDKVSSNEDANSSLPVKLSPLTFKPSLYPTIKLQDQDNAPKESSPVKDSKSPETHHHESPSKIPVGKRQPKDILAQTKPLAHSPPKEKIIDMSKQPTNSPLSNLFATVGSTLRKARNKFSKDNEQPKVDPKSKVHKPKRSSTTSPKLGPESPSKRVISNSENVLSRLTAPTEASQSKDAKRVISGTSNVVAESPTKNNDERNSLKFSPVKSIYGSLRFEMNKSVNNSPSKKTQLKSPIKPTAAVNLGPNKHDEDLFNEKKDDARKSQGSKFTAGQPKNLTRVSLSKPQRSETTTKENGQLRKSFAKSLASMPLESSSKSLNRFRPKSLVAGDHQPLKRKTQTEEEIKNTSTTNHPYRKIGTKIVPPSIAKQQQDAKRRRTADQLQSVLQKRALRVSNTRHDHAPLEQKVEEVSKAAAEEPKDRLQHLQQQQQPQPQPQIVQPQPQAQPPPPQQQLAARIIPQNNTKHSKYGQVPNTQTLMKTAVLQHARMNNENTKVNPFQNGAMGKNSSSITPVTPKPSTVLPEIFSESDDDEEGSVLKDWANSPELRNILINQQHIDPDQVFGPMAPLQMEEIFKNSRLSRFKGRGSSAQWSGQDGLTIQEVESYKLQKTYKK